MMPANTPSMRLANGPTCLIESILNLVGSKSSAEKMDCCFSAFLFASLCFATIKIIMAAIKVIIMPTRAMLAPDH